MPRPAGVDIILEFRSIGLDPWGLVALISAIAVSIAIGVRVITEWRELPLGKRASGLFELTATMLIGFALFAQGQQHSSAIETLTQRLRQAEGTLANVQENFRRQMGDANIEIAQLHTAISSLQRASADGADNMSIVSQAISRLQTIVAEALQSRKLASPAVAAEAQVTATESLASEAALRILSGRPEYRMDDSTDSVCVKRGMVTIDLSRQERYCVDVGHSWVGHLASGADIAVLPVKTPDGRQDNALLYAIDASSQRYLGTALFAPHPWFAIDVQGGYLVIVYKEQAQDAEVHAFRNVYDPTKKRLHSID